MARDNQRDIQYLKQLQDFYADCRVIPPYDALMRLWGLRSKSSARFVVQRLQDKGYIQKNCDRYLVPGPKFFLREIALSSVAAGEPVEVSEYLEDGVSIDQFLVKHPSNTLLVKVKGDSMINAHILPGDLVVVERGETAKIGDIVVAIVNGDLTVKYLRETKQRVRYLEPANPNYPDIHPEHLEIFGVVKGLARSFS